MKKCPHCNEQIQEEAKKCRYCQKWLTDEHETIIKSVGMVFDKKLRNIIIAGIIIIILSVVYYCVYSPLKNEYVIKKCSKESTAKRTLEELANKKEGNSLDENIYDKCLGDRGLTR